MATDNGCMDSDDDDLLAEEALGDKVTKESFLSMVENASEGGDFLKILNLLPNSSQRYGHSLMPSLRFYAVIPLLKTVAQDSTPQR